MALRSMAPSFRASSASTEKLALSPQLRWESEVRVQLGLKTTRRVVVGLPPILAVTEQDDVVRRLGQLRSERTDPRDRLRLPHELGPDLAEEAVRLVDMPREKENEQCGDGHRK